MEDDYPDLRKTLAAVHQQARACRAIWCVPAEGFETTVSTRRGVVFGGAWSPRHDPMGMLASGQDMVKKGKITCQEAVTSDRCDLCNRKNEPLTKHHLIPRVVHTKKRFINRFGKAEMIRRGLMICKLCHDGIHDLIPSEKELAERFNTKELLLGDERIRKHVEWVRRQK